LRDQPIVFEYLTYLDGVRDTADQALWFRGVGKASYKLQPSLFRHSQSGSIEDFIALELSILQTFRQRSIPFLEREVVDPWDWFFLMQHYGVPTRLWDWTESPMIALFFAVTSADHKITTSGDLSFSTYAAVWVLKPAEWNERAVDLDSFGGKVLSTLDPLLRTHKPEPDCGNLRPPPLAIFGAHNSRRIVAQRWVFTVFGRSTKPAETFYTESSFPDGLLHKLALPKASLPSLAHSLGQHGVVDSVAFPELEGFAREIKRQLRFAI
jgi:hypothetical protein